MNTTLSNPQPLLLLVAPCDQEAITEMARKVQRRTSKKGIRYIQMPGYTWRYSSGYRGIF